MQQPTETSQTSADPAFRTLDFLSTDDVARYLGLSSRTLERFRVEGRGPAYHKFGRAVKYRRDNLLEWAERQLRHSTSEAA